MEEILNYEKAAVSLAENFFSPSIEGGFRKACVASLDYITRLQTGKGLDEKTKEVVSIILTLGTRINNFYDIRQLEIKEYRQLRELFKERCPNKEDDFRKYRKELSQLEKNRPIPSVCCKEGRSRLEPIKKYREAVNRLSVAFSFSIVFDKSLSNYYEDYDNLSDEDRSIFEGFNNAVMAMQVVDDIVGRAGDIKHDRPSFYTASCAPQEIETQEVLGKDENTYKILDRLFSDYYNLANNYVPQKIKPILDAVKLTRTVYPRLTDLAKKYSKLEKIGGINILTWRDKADR